MKIRCFALSTSDNPFDVFDNFDEWQAFDHQKGYFSSEYLARIAKTSSKLSDQENEFEKERAIDEIIYLNTPSEDTYYKDKSLVHFIKVERELEI